MPKILIDHVEIGGQEVRCLTQNVRDQRLDTDRLAVGHAIFDTSGVNMAPDEHKCIQVTLRLRMV